ncbi:GNAT family N-acetyltransferase [Undibacterium terreum]|uniref:N-acetyltransferase n=1 Tax=Undibacterium terreum TaxID=1224302 RepID=A0A916UJB7_9BURK|nr:GNAT family protein [Undibacterium terreum]GGC75653.1 N-acetyltransferase [Undibacterium terreum]
MTVPTLETPRLILTQNCQEDWPLFLQLERDPDVLRYISDQRSEEELRNRFARRLPVWSKLSEQWLGLTVKEKKSGIKIGMHGFMPMWQPYRQAELGYSFLPDWHGHGYASEATRAVIEFAFAICGFHKLTATVTSGNNESVKLLQKVGFLQEGCLRDNFIIGGNWYDDLKFGLLERDRK